MRSIVGRWSTSKVVRGLVAGTALLGVVHSAAARDDTGVHDFFSSMFGGGEQAAPASAPAEAPRFDQMPYGRAPGQSIRRPFASRAASDRPLTVKLHRPKTARANQFAQMPTRPGKVSIFEDKTLRRGDAVMTAKGIRIFAGSKSWPYQEGDFVALADAGQMDKGLQKVLLDLDHIPYR